MRLLIAAIFNLNLTTINSVTIKDATDLAEQRFFFSRPYFDYTGKRYGHLFKKKECYSYAWII
jgi:hypothetical protein